LIGHREKNGSDIETDIASASRDDIKIEIVLRNSRSAFCGFSNGEKA
jgi:hypothetical protein